MNWSEEKGRWSGSWWLLSLLACCFMFGSVAGDTIRRLPGSVNPGDMFQYRWGDSPKDSSGQFTWTYLEDGWLETDDLRELPAPGNRNFMWLRFELKPLGVEDPAFIINSVSQVLEAYIEGKMVYRSGEMKADWLNRYEYQRWHSIPYDKYPDAKHIVIRVFSDDPSYLGCRDTAILMSESGYLKAIFARDVEQTVLGKMFGFFGLMAVFVGFSRRGRTRYATLSFAAFVLFVGMFLMGMTELKQVFLDAPLLWYEVALFGFYLFPPALYAFIDLTFGGGYKNILRRIWQFHLILSICLIIADIAGVFPRLERPTGYELFMIIEIIVAIGVTLRNPSVYDEAGRVMFAAVLVMAATGIVDILQGMEIIIHDRFYFHWGVLALIMAMGYVLEREFSLLNQGLANSANELEVKSNALKMSNRKLEKYTEILNRLINERSQQLETRHYELEASLQELQNAENQLVMKEKMASLGNLVAGVAHEVNTPIGAVNSASDVTARCISKIRDVISAPADDGLTLDDARLQKYLGLLESNNRLVVDAGGRVKKIVQSLRDFTRKETAQPETFDLHEGIDSTLTLVFHELKYKVDVQKDYGDISPISGYPNQINQVFMNLFVNAAQAMEDRGVLSIRTEAVENGVQIVIADNGKGIAPKNLGRIFDPGFTTKGVGVGTGLGLSICYNIIQKHNGSIRVKSEVGDGTEFTIVLPVKPKLEGGSNGVAMPAKSGEVSQ